MPRNCSPGAGRLKLAVSLEKSSLSKIEQISCIQDFSGHLLSLCAQWAFKMDSSIPKLTGQPWKPFLAEHLTGNTLWKSLCYSGFGQKISPFWDMIYMIYPGLGPLHFSLPLTNVPSTGHWRHTRKNEKRMQGKAAEWCNSRGWERYVNTCFLRTDFCNINTWLF